MISLDASAFRQLLELLETSMLFSAERDNAEDIRDHISYQGKFHTYISAIMMLLEKIEEEQIAEWADETELL
jgi:hypothetical protein